MKKRLYRLDRIEKGLHNFLYEDQIRALSLTKRSRRAVWSPETILKAQKIRRAVGTKGYEYLREMGYPLPSYRTLCNRLETKIMVTTDMSCEMLAELGLGIMAPCDSPSEGVGDNDEEELIGVLSWSWQLASLKPSKECAEVAVLHICRCDFEQQKMATLCFSSHLWKTEASI